MPDGLLDTPAPELLVRLRQADSLAWKEIVNRYRPQLHRHVSSIIKDKAQAEDVTQEVLLRMYQAVTSEQFPDDSNLAAWAWTTARNAALNDVRDRANRERLLAESLPADPHASSDPERDAVARETMDRVQAVVAKLPETDRNLVAQIVAPHSEEPALSALGTTERSRLSRLRQWLRERIFGGEKTR